MLKKMKHQIKLAKNWRAKVKKTGLEKGEATVAELRELLPEAYSIQVTQAWIRKFEHAGCYRATPSTTGLFTESHHCPTPPNLSGGPFG